MDAADVRNLYEAYRSVYEDRESLNEDCDYDLYDDDYIEEAADNVIMSVKSPSGKPRSVSRLRTNSERPSETDARRFSQMLSDRGKKRESDVQAQRFAYLTKRGIERATNRSERDENDYSDVRVSIPKSKPARELRGAERQQAFRDIRQKKVDQKFKDQGNVRQFRRRHGLPESYDLYDVVLDHLLDEGYCDDVESAEIIMTNMSEEWLDGILEGVADKKVPPEIRAKARNARAGFIKSIGSEESRTRNRRAEHKERRGMRGNIGGEGGASYRYDDNMDKDYPSIKVRGRGYA